MKNLKLDYTACPPHLQGGMQRYIEEKIAPGHFLRFALQNDLVRSINYADEASLASLTALAAFMYNELPTVVWGSEEAVRRWLAGDCVHGVSRADRCFECDPNTGTEDRQ